MLISKRAVVPPKKFKDIIKARIRVYDIVEKVFASEIKPCDVFSCMHECMRKKTQSMKLKLSHDILATQAYIRVVEDTEFMPYHVLLLCEGRRNSLIFEPLLAPQQRM